MALSNIEIYSHHGADVSVRSDVKGKHREHCLCFDGCIHFKPGQSDNCEIAQDVFRNCVKHAIVTPVWECQRFAR